MNVKDAKALIKALRPLNPERQLVILDWLRAPAGEKEYPAMSMQEEMVTARCLADTSNDPFGAPFTGDTTFDEVIAALEEDKMGECDNCGEFGPLNHHEVSAAGETSQCKWGCLK